MGEPDESVSQQQLHFPEYEWMTQLRSGLEHVGVWIGRGACFVTDSVVWTHHMLLSKNSSRHST
jgi:hypothetical protein